MGKGKKRREKKRATVRKRERSGEGGKAGSAR
jgi:hypothetical protein